MLITLDLSKIVRARLVGVVGIVVEAKISILFINGVF